MGNSNTDIESPENFEQKCLCVLVLDVSVSMSGNRIDELNNGLKEFHKDILNDTTTANRLEISIVTFGSHVNTILPPSLVDNFKIPKLEIDGSTKLVDGVKEAISIIDSRKEWYKNTGQPYFRPWIVLMTDGCPDTDQDVTSLSKEILASTDEKKYLFYALGVESANMDILKKISHPDFPPAKLKGLKFSDFFKWLSNSMSIITEEGEGGSVNLPNPEDWMAGFEI